jgi:hypothetical protein
MSAGKSKSELAKDAREINRIHGQIVENAQTNLQLAIECGTILTEDKKSVQHGEWEEWLKTNCPEIEDRTARLYMRLAKNSDKLEKLAAENGNTVADLSIRGAVMLLQKKKTEEEKAKAKAERERKAKEKDAAALVAAMAGANLVDIMKAKSIDEIKIALKQSARSDEVIAAIAPSLQDQLKSISPSKLALLLTSTSVWPAENVPALLDEISKRVKSSSAPQMTIRPGPAQTEART